MFDQKKKKKKPIQKTPTFEGSNTEAPDIDDLLTAEVEQEPEVDDDLEREWQARQDRKHRGSCGCW
jgi:hypothetical protein